MSAREKILREIFSNLLAHRDYSSAYVTKFVIEKLDRYNSTWSVTKLVIKLMTKILIEQKV